MEFWKDLAQRIYHNADDQIMVLDDPNNRLFALYLLTSGLIAFFVFLKAKQMRQSEETSFLRFLFPKKVWSHPSAWLDLRYFVFNGIVGRFFLIGITGVTTAFSYKLFSGGISFTAMVGTADLPMWQEFAISVSFMVVAFLVSDFLAWYCHYLQHKSPMLWQFHKVHHSSEVMHPVSNYREHPIDNVLYLAVIGFGYGIVLAVAVRTLGYLPSMPMILGVPILMFAFNAFGYNLRHSHIWLRWPGRLSMIFPSPAHHHVHHSSHPDHLDKNFAFMFPVWDVIFRTYEMPEDDRDVKFGIGDGNAEELNTCLSLYWVPFRDAYRVLRAQWKGQKFNMSRPQPVRDDPVEQPKVHPAE